MDRASGRRSGSGRRREASSEREGVDGGSGGKEDLLGCCIEDDIG